MASTKRTPEQKLQIAQGWPAARRRGLKQRQYAQECGIADRSLRAYLREFLPTTSPVDQLRKIVIEFIAALTRLEARLDDLDADPAGLPADESLLAEQSLDRQAGEICTTDQLPEKPRRAPARVAAVPAPVGIQGPPRQAIDPDLAELLVPTQTALLAKLGPSSPSVETANEITTNRAPVAIHTDGMPTGSGEEQTAESRTWSWAD